MELVRWFDYPLFILFFAVAFFIGKLYSKRFVEKDLQSYFLWGLSLKMLSSLAYIYLYVFYYGYGDTINFYRFGQHYKNLLRDIENLSFSQWFFMDNNTFIYLTQHNIRIGYGWAESSFFMNKLSGILSFFTFDSFLINTTIFSVVAFTGVWALYITLIKLYPKIKRDLAIAILFFPSVVFWGAGLMKDTVVLGAQGWTIWAVINIFFLKKKSFTKILISLVVLWISIYAILSVKIYIIIALSVGLSLWFFHSFALKVKNRIIRIIILPALLIAGLLIGLYGLNAMSEELGSYALENILETALITADYIDRLGGGSSYDIGEINPGIMGLMQKTPVILNITFFRPYLWEINSFVMIFAALESFFVLMLVLTVIYKTGLRKTLATISFEGYVLFCFVVSFILGFASGLTAQNFGTLIRYKMPIMPFFISAILVIFYKANGYGLFTKTKT